MDFVIRLQTVYSVTIIMKTPTPPPSAENIRRSQRANKYANVMCEKCMCTLYMTWILIDFRNAQYFVSGFWLYTRTFVVYLCTVLLARLTDSKYFPEK